MQLADCCLSRASLRITLVDFRNCSLLLGLLLSGSLDSHAVVPLVDSLLSELLVDLSLLHVSGEGLNLASGGGLGQGEDSILSVLGGGLELLGGGVVDLTLLGLTSGGGEEDQL